MVDERSGRCVMIDVELEAGQWSAGDTCRCRTRIRAPRPTPAQRVVATVTAHETIHAMPGSEPSKKRVLYSRSVELLPAAHYESCELPFEVRIPDLDELDYTGEPPAFVRKLVEQFTPGKIGPIRFEVEVRMERRWRRDWTARTEIAVPGCERELRAS